MAESGEPIREQPSNHAGQAGHFPPEEASGADAELEHPSINYERRDVPFRWVLLVAIIGVSVGAVIFGLVYAFFRADTERLASRRESEFPLAEHPSNELPARPRLEEVDRLAGDAREDVYQRLLAKEDQLERYGETQEKGFVQIPIRRAMESLAGQLPVRKQPQGPSKDNGLLDSGASNSGRLYRGAPR
jgi:hypothetical protein